MPQHRTSSTAAAASPRPSLARLNRSRAGRLVGIFHHLLVRDSPAVEAALAELLQKCGGPRRVLALLVEGYGPPVVALLRKRKKKNAAIASLLERTKEDTRSFSLAMVRRLARGAHPRRALAKVVEKYGAGVLGQLYAVSQDPHIRRLLELKAPRPPGRPPGRTSRDLLSWSLATLVDEYDIPPVRLLAALGRSTVSGSADFGWLRQRLARGRKLRAGAQSREPTVDAIIAFYRSYYRGDRLGLCTELGKHLRQARVGTNPPVKLLEAFGLKPRSGS